MYSWDQFAVYPSTRLSSFLPLPWSGKDDGDDLALVNVVNSCFVTHLSCARYRDGNIMGWSESLAVAGCHHSRGGYRS